MPQIFFFVSQPPPPLKRIDIWNELNGPYSQSSDANSAQGFVRRYMIYFVTKELNTNITYLYSPLLLCVQCKIALL